jgi:hypothetical protein
MAALTQHFKGVKDCYDDDTIHMTRYEPRTLEAIRSDDMHCFSMNMSQIVTETISEYRRQHAVVKSVTVYSAIIILPESFVSRRFPALYNVCPFFYNQDLSNHTNCSVLHSTSLIFASSLIQNEDRTIKPEILPPSVVLILHLSKYRTEILTTSYHTQCTELQHWVGVLREEIISIIMATNRCLELKTVTDSRLPVT